MELARSSSKCIVRFTLVDVSMRDLSNVLILSKYSMIIVIYS